MLKEGGMGKMCLPTDILCIEAGAEEGRGGGSVVQ